MEESMALLLRIAVVTLSLFIARATNDRALAQSSCLATETAKEILSKAGVPTNEAQLLLLALVPDSTADASLDQVTQLSPTFANRNANQLKTEDKDLDKAQQFVKT